MKTSQDFVMDGQVPYTNGYCIWKGEITVSNAGSFN